MEKDLNFFLSYTKEDGECLVWTRCKNTDGYARTAYNGSSNGKVHRIVYQLANPHEVITDKVIMHTCDNPLCINPNHLKSGSFDDNNKDRDKKERNGWAKLTHNQVRAARVLFASGQYTYKQLASLYEVDYRTMHSLINRKHWKSVA